jgi:HSP90 family molecular chaperone
MNPNFIKNLQKRRCNYNNPDQATSQANSLILLSSGIYTEEERFVFELLQNAVDAHNEESELLNVRMIINDNYFIFMHNGDAFSERDIEGLCDVGNGNKMKDVKKIGYKGIGFKSVFMRSTDVTVLSGDYCFKFDKTFWDGYWDEKWNNSEFVDKDVNSN